MSVNHITVLTGCSPPKRLRHPHQRMFTAEALQLHSPFLTEGCSLLRHCSYITLPHRRMFAVGTRQLHHPSAWAKTLGTIPKDTGKIPMRPSVATQSDPSVARANTFQRQNRRPVRAQERTTQLSPVLIRDRQSRFLSRESCPPRDQSPFPALTCGL